MRTVTSHFVMVIQQIRLPKFGEYTIDLAVDGRQLGSLPLYVSKVEPARRRRINYRLSVAVESTI